MVGPTNHGIDDADRPGPERPLGQLGQPAGHQPSTRARASPIIPVFDPVYYATGVTQGRTADLKVANFIGFFIESRSGNNVYGRITPVTGIVAGSQAARSRRRVPDSHSPRGVIMAQLAALLVSSDEDFRRDFGRLVRSGSVPIGIVDDRSRAGARGAGPRLRGPPRRRRWRPRCDRAAARGASRAVDLRDRADERSPTSSCRRCGPAPTSSSCGRCPRSRSMRRSAARRRGGRRRSTAAASHPRRSCSSAPRAAQARRRSR